MNHPFVAIVNYNVGNLKAISDVCELLDFNAVITDDHEIIKAADKIILPGVGSFDWALDRLNSSGLREIVEDCVIKHSVPILGICVGMQLFMEESEEGKLSGLGWIEGSCMHFEKLIKNTKLPIPHMGWNSVEASLKTDLFDNVKSSEFYFLHSYFVKPTLSENILGTTYFGDFFCSAVSKDNIFGVQFHPEKSHTGGVSLIKNFLEAQIC